MKKNYFTVTSASDGMQLSVMEMIPDQVDGVMQLVHGMSEHKERYLPFMYYLADHNIATIIHDHRGHGYTATTNDDLGFFNEEKAQYIVNDVDDVYKIMKEQFPDVPYTLFGHSMGSLVVRKYLQQHDDQIDRLIVCGAPGNNPLVDEGLLLVEKLEQKYGSRHRSKAVSKLSTGLYDRKFKGKLKNRWISADEDNVKAFNSHEKDGFTFTLNGYKNLFQLVKDVYTPGSWKKANLDMPILFIAGEDDPVILSTEKWIEAQRFLKAEGYRNVKGILFEGMRHEILNETNKDLVYRHILEFVQKGDDDHED